MDDFSESIAALQAEMKSMHGHVSGRTLPNLLRDQAL